tara:strand:- start:267 stop:1115 length:849 start_codon:yes stop_codon:yes gene_type:complete
MVVVTDKKYYMDNFLVKKLDLMADRTEKKMDNLILIDGDEGQGKSNLAMGVAHYFAWKAKRTFNVDNVFFDLDELINFAKDTKDKVIVWDEGALGGMAAEWWKKNQIEFVKLLMIARKKRHFIVICIPKFFKLNEYLVVDRSIGLLHVYARNEIERGRFVYYGKSNKEKLFYNWRRTKQRNYKRYYDFRGSFLEYLPKVIDEAKYEAKKDDAIMNFKKEKPKVSEAAKKKIEMHTEGKLIDRLSKNMEGVTQQKLEKWLEIPLATIQKRLRDYRAANKPLKD